MTENQTMFVAEFINENKEVVVRRLYVCNECELIDKIKIVEESLNVKLYKTYSCNECSIVSIHEKCDESIKKIAKKK